MAHTRIMKRALMRKTWREEDRQRLSLPMYSLGEEIFSAVSHGAGALFGAVALILLLVYCEKTPVTVISVCVFGGTMVLLYTVSALYHALGINKAKKVFQVLDHCTIFLLIAGTYTPMTLCCIRGVTGIVLFAVVWIAAIVGIVLNAVSVERFQVFSMVCYLSMGWVVVFAMKTVLQRLSSFGLGFLLAGGIVYTLGAVLYGFGKKVPYVHSVWHLFVLAGSILHTVTVFAVVV